MVAHDKDQCWKRQQKLSLLVSQGLFGSSPNSFNEVDKMASSMEDTSDEKMPLLAEEGKVKETQDTKANGDEAGHKRLNFSWEQCHEMHRIFACFV